MYFQCDVDTDVADWSDDRIWEELQARLGANGYTLKEGPITSKMVLPFRSFVQEPMRHGNLLLAGDAAHTVPPTGAKGLNLALADVRVLAEELERAISKNDGALLDDYTTRALDRVWKAQHFSYWMTTMLHLLPESSPFDVRRQIGELSTVTSSRPGPPIWRRPTRAGRAVDASSTCDLRWWLGNTSPQVVPQPDRARSHRDARDESERTVAGDDEGQRR